jgi:hypothetical protein
MKTKDDAIIIINNCAAMYKENLADKNILFVTVQGDEILSFEAIFRPSNFMHLTGVSSRLDGDRFFQAAISNRLGAKDITLSPDGKTELKLEVLPQLMNIHKIARMVGDYDNTMPLLVTNKFAGTVTMAMGFINKNGLYIPNTALKKDLREITERATRRRVAVIFVKPRMSIKYKCLTYLSKDIDINSDNLIAAINEKVDMQNIIKI